MISFLVFLPRLSFFMHLRRVILLCCTYEYVYIIYKCDLYLFIQARTVFHIALI